MSVSINNYVVSGVDWSTTINTAISDIASHGGGIIEMPRGVYTLPTTVHLKSNVILRGEGFGRTILQGQSGTSHSLVETEGFASLIGTNSTGGPLCFGLRDLTIDGNRWNRTGAGRCLQIYGYDYELTNVEIFDSCGIGLYSEWSVIGNVPVTPYGKDTMEAHITGLRVFRCAGDGVIFRGPHDTIFKDVLTFINTGVGISFEEGNGYTAGGCMVDQLHSYGNNNWGIKISTMIFGGVIESESNTAGGGIQINTPGGRVQGGTLIGWGNTGHGVQFNDDANAVSVIANNNTGDGIHLYSKNNRLSISTFSNGGSGLVYGGAANNNTVSPCTTYGNAGKGVYFQANDNRLYGLAALGNGTGGLQLASGIGGVRIDGECAANTGVQVDFGTLNGPAIIDLLIYTNPGQTAWTGNPGNNFVRIASRGADTHPYNSVQV